mmetsp:Transcript_6994/g.11054  ORF Transcript_6994/g.11054 Transcript_6994/m.11054 type:complete len:291 (-) Transcript_6994:114-986(-)
MCTIALLCFAPIFVLLVSAMDETIAKRPRTGNVVFLWSHPRALSTALLRSLSELSHTTTVLEPFMIPWQADIGVLDREKFPQTLTFDDVLDKIEKGAYFTKEDQYIQVIKDMPVHVSSQLLRNIFERFPRAHHVFLVRHPFRMIPSYFKIPDVATYSEDVIEKDVSFKPLLDLADQISLQGTVLLLDAETLLADPKKSLTILCDYIGAKFEESLLHWKPGDIPSSWHDLEAFDGWLDNVVSSSGWKPRPVDSTPPYPELDNEFQRKCIDANFAIYEQLMRKYGPSRNDDL